MPTKANAGPDKNYPAGTKEILLDGSGSTDAMAINWYYETGPTKANMRDQNDVRCRVNEIADGDYVFRLKTRGPDGSVSEDKVAVKIGGAVTDPKPEEPKPQDPKPGVATIVKVVIHYSDGTTEEKK